MLYVCVDSLHLYMYCVFDMHMLYMCRYACTCIVYLICICCTCAARIVKHAFSVYVLCIHVCICMSTLKCMYTCSMIMHVCVYCACKVYSYTSDTCMQVFY